METHVPYSCHGCGAPFVVAFAPDTSERELTPAPCPRCGVVSFIDVPGRAAHHLEFRVLGEQVVAQECNGCRVRFEVAFFGEPNEASARAPVACPRCGWVNYAWIAESSLKAVTEGPSYTARQRTAVPRTRGATRKT
jgi:DNA-directed RNA polymerase subunit RPC12/RpoP